MALRSTRGSQVLLPGLFGHATALDLGLGHSTLLVRAPRVTKGLDVEVGGDATGFLPLRRLRDDLLHCISAAYLAAR